MLIITLTISPHISLLYSLTNLPTTLSPTSLSCLSHLSSPPHPAQAFGKATFRATKYEEEQIG